MRVCIGIFLLCLSGTMVAAETWSCKNDMEIHCGRSACEASGSFTPMDITLKTKGEISVCAYSGCWEGKATVTKDSRYLVFIGHNLTFSTSSNKGNGESAIITIDRMDGVGILKVTSFAQPLICSTN